MRASDDYALDSTRQDAGLSAQGECQCGLPASVWAHKSQMLTLLELEIDTAKTMVAIDHVCVCAQMAQTNPTIEETACQKRDGRAN
jgi:hypothetical protein